MNIRELAVQVLAEKGQVIIKCNGNSMRPMIYPKQDIHLLKVPFEKLRIGDAVFCKTKSNLTVHKIGAIDYKERRALIQNNAGFKNGWIGANGIFGVCTRVDEKVIISEKELNLR